MSAWLLTLMLASGPALPVASDSAAAVRTLADSTTNQHATAGPARSWYASAWNETGAPLFTPRTVGILAAGAALTGAALAIEDPERDARALEQPGFDQAADLGNLYGNGVTLGAGSLALLGAGAALHDERSMAAGIDAIRALGAAEAAVGVLKLAVRRTRPDGGAYSFPSGHTAGAFAIAPVLANHFGWTVGGAAYALASMTAMGRLEDRRHYLSDVVFGAALGTAAGRGYSGARSTSGHAVSVTLRGGQAALSLRF